MDVREEEGREGRVEERKKGGREGENRRLTYPRLYVHYVIPLIPYFLFFLFLRSFLYGPRYRCRAARYYRMRSRIQEIDRLRSKSVFRR